TIRADEGTEQTVWHTASKTFDVLPDILKVTKSHEGDFVAGMNGSYTLLVSNEGQTTIAGTTTVRDVLPAGLHYVSATGAGWSCEAVGQTVTCTSTESVASGNDMAPVTLTVKIAGNLGSSIANQASVANSAIVGGTFVPGNTDVA